MVQLRPLATDTQDDAFREIQLNGKQLVFLFMVATVVSVVIFLCGVFVGRGVRAERSATLTDASVATPITTPDVAPDTAAPPRADSDPFAAAPPPAVDELSYFNRLEQPGQSAEELKTAGAKTPAVQKDKTSADKSAPASTAAAENTPLVEQTPGKASVARQAQAAAPDAGPAPAAPAAAVRASAPPPALAPPAATPAPDAAPAVVSAALSEPKASGYALQVTALRERGEAEAVAKRLSAKGYAAYVMTPPANGAPQYYRVRIGKFQTRREAEDIASRLQKEEQIKPWITR